MLKKKKTIFKLMHLLQCTHRYSIILRNLLLLIQRHLSTDYEIMTVCFDSVVVCLFVNAENNVRYKKVSSAVEMHCEFMEVQ